jgi:hypothetical protein
MYEITQRVTVKDGDREVELPVGRIRDTDAVRYGLLDGPVKVAEQVDEPAEEPTEPKKATKKATKKGAKG